MNQLFPTSLAPNIEELLPKQPLSFKGADAGKRINDALFESDYRA